MPGASGPAPPSAVTRPWSFGPTLELGQALLRTPLGESFGGAAIEIDLVAADEAYRRAIELAEQLHDDRALAASLREIGTINFARGAAGSRPRCRPVGRTR